MPASPSNDIPVFAPNLKALVRAIFERAGWNDRDAALAADHLVLANLSGHDSHGVGMVPRYMLAAGKGLLKKGATITTVVDAGALLTLDGGMGLGQVVGFDAMNLAIERARVHGAGRIVRKEAAMVNAALPPETGKKAWLGTFGNVD